jgi:hypothetical protein
MKFKTHFTFEENETGRLRAWRPTAFSLMREGSRAVLDFCAALFDAQWRAFHDVQALGFSSQPRLPERRRFSLPHRPSIWRSKPMTAKASRACESDLWERRLRVRQRWSASGGTLGTRGQWPSPCTRFFPIAMSLRSTTAAMRRAAAGQAQTQCYRIRL